MSSKEETGEKLIIRYDTQPAQINAGTLLSSLFNFVALIEEINSEVFPEQRLEIKIEAFEPGSFTVLTRILGSIGEIFKKAMNGIENIQKIIEIFRQIIELKKFLAGEEPVKAKEANGDILVTNSQGNNIVVNRNTYNIYTTNSVANKYLKHAFEALIEDPSIGGIELQHRDSYTQVEKDELPSMISENPLLKEKTEVQYIENAALTPVKVVFQKNRKWEFIYKGQKISAYILDDKFFEKIHTIRFSKADKLYAEMEIEKVFDPKLNTYLIKEYRILKIKKHEPGPVQQMLFQE